MLTSNIAVPVPDPKKMTDEDLKRYGIHVASRLDEDDTAGQSKWADLDDDDEDWAPEAITWTDGTKTTLAHNDEPLAPLAAPAPPVRDPSVRVPLVLEKRTEPVAPVALVAPVAPVEPLPIISPTKSSGLAAGKGLKLKGTPAEKRTLVAKPPAPPQPSRSPWAPIPAVERAPIAPEPAPPASRVQPMTLSQKMPSSAPPPPPPKELAADDFSRSSWRGGEPQARELYNSQSGLYEPVSDRRSSRQFNQPILQRNSHTDQPEPSSAFQTHRTSEGGTGYGRRRGSSIVSGGSGSYLRTLQGNDGRIAPQDMPGMRRPSFAGSVESQGPPGAMSIPGQGQHRYQQGPGFGPQSISPSATFASLHQAGPPVQMQPLPQSQLPPQVLADEVEFQKKLMKERTEMARKRRQEQEAAEEAARRERIQKKLDAMGPAPEKKTDKAKASPVVAVAKPTQIQQRDHSEASKPAQPPATGQRDRRESASKSADVGPQPTPAATPNRQGPPPGSRRLSHSQEASQPDQWTGSGPRSDRVPPWSQPAPPQQPFRNVWASPNTERGLGNGTFNPELSRVAGSTAQPQPGQGPAPAPIGPPGGGRQPSHDRPQHQPAPIGSRTSRYGQQPQPRAQVGVELASKWVTGVAENDKKISEAGIAQRAERDRQLAERGINIEEAQPTLKDTWRPVHVPGDGTRRSMPPADPKQAATWQSPEEERTASREGPVPHAAPIGTGGKSILPQSGQGTPSQSRSRFFPTRDARLEKHAQASLPQSPSPPPPTMDDHPAYEGNVIHPQVQLPRPQPVVKLPPHVEQAQQQEKHSFAWATPAPYKENARAPSGAQNRQGQTAGNNWQQRFDSLLNAGKHSPPKPTGVDPASKSALDYHIPLDYATVSLPGGLSSSSTPLTVPSIIGLVKTIVSKPMAEECFDEPEIGSLPRVRVPHKAPEAAWQPANTQAKLLPKRFVVQAAGRDAFYFSPEVVSSGNIIHVLLPGMSTAKTAVLPITTTREGSRGEGRRSGRATRGRSHRGSSRRDTVSQDARESGQSGRGGYESSNRGSHENRDSTHTGETRGRGSRGYRGRGSESWNRHTPTQSLQA